MPRLGLFGMMFAFVPCSLQPGDEYLIRNDNGLSTLEQLSG